MHGEKAGNPDVTIVQQPLPRETHSDVALPVSTLSNNGGHKKSQSSSGGGFLNGSHGQEEAKEKIKNAFKHGI